MADRSSDKGREDVSSTLGGASRLGAEGGKDAHGASGAGREGKGPSSQPVSEGIEGSILDDATEQQSQSRTGEGRQRRRPVHRHRQRSVGRHSRRAGRARPVTALQRRERRHRAVRERRHRRSHRLRAAARPHARAPERLRRLR